MPHNLYHAVDGDAEPLRDRFGRRRLFRHKHTISTSPAVWQMTEVGSKGTRTFVKSALRKEKSK